MYLIDNSTFELKWFPADRPPYAILSHTWGPDEVIFREFGDLSKAKGKAGFNKIKLTCEQSLKDGVKYAWVDTCCIDKDSSSELSEAINSMFKWYQDAAFCYAYIEDLPEEVKSPVIDPLVLENCRWFSRGWTLQELLAPRNIIFFGSKWNQIGSKKDLNLVLAKVTGIPSDILTNLKRLDEVSVADRMSWAAGRNTTRVEDIAYSLMGIFDVNMPMLYGEGAKAFIRLQEEILRQTRDDSLFAWQASEQSASENPYRGFIKPFNTPKAGGTSILGNGHVSLSCVVYKDSGITGALGLKCFRGTDLSKVVSIEVIGIGGNALLRFQPSKLVMRAHKNNPTFETVRIEKYAAKSEALALDDIYRSDAFYIRDIPQEVHIKNLFPAEFASFVETGIFPLVNLIGKKVTMELDIDTEVSGIFTFEKIGWDTDGLTSSKTKAPISLSIWLEPIEGSGLYRHCFNIDVDTRTIGSPEPAHITEFNEGTNCQTIPIGWSTLKVMGSCAKIDGYMMFCISINLSVDMARKAEAKAKENEKEAEQKEEEAKKKEEEAKQKEEEAKKKKEEAKQKEERKKRDSERNKKNCCCCFMIMYFVLLAAMILFTLYFFL